MTEKVKKLNIILVSDSVGETAFNLMRAACAQFPTVDFKYIRYPFITSASKLQKVLHEIQPLPDKIIAFTLVHEEEVLAVIKWARENKTKYVDLMSSVIEDVRSLTKLEPSGEVGAVHNLSKKYFDRISAMEFAVMYDDGKDPKGFLEADVVLLGVSRTSKTPLSLFLANKNLKVANLPLVPQTHIPEEVYQIDPKRIVGLTNDPKVLNSIRRQRMIAYGLNPDTAYSNINSINAELAAADRLYKKLGCYVINVANRSIEETAALIMAHLGIHDFQKQPL